MATTASATKPTARERLLAAADELFYREGVQSVGVDRVVQLAGVAKASLYNLFGSKDQLVEAYLDARTDATRDQVERTLTRFRTPRERLLGVFDAQGQVFTQPDFNGCAHLTASAEAEAGSPVEYANNRYRQWVGGHCSPIWRGRQASPTPKTWHGSCSFSTTERAFPRGWTAIHRRRPPRAPRRPRAIRCGDQD